MKKTVPFFFSLVLLFMLPLNTFASTLDDIKSIIESDYVGEIDGDLNGAKTIDEVIEMLDPYSDYFTKEEYESFTESVDMTSVGIGVVIQKHEKGILITDAVENGSAFKSGIEAGDIITAVDGKPIADLSIEEAQALIMGEENTRVIITILKEDGTSLEKSITRQKFSMPNVTSELLYGNVGYIAMNSFSEDGVQLIAQEYNELSNQGATSFILDLQYNGGGYVSTAEELIGMFPRAFNAYKLKLSTGTYIERATFQSSKFPINSRVLVNRFSASASEMTAAALLDQDAAILYGETTYGKGTMQGFYQLVDGSYLKLTVGEFTGPKGTPVKDVGVTPDIVTTTNPLYQAHFDAIKQNLTSYKQLSSLSNVSTTKTFKVTFSKELNKQINANAIKLVALGENELIDASYKINGKQLVITPNEKLVAGAQYMLIIHPTIKDANGKLLKSGIYLHVIVKEATE